MTTIAVELQRLIDKSLPQLKSIEEKYFTYKPSPQKWSKKEIIGHLVDSAQSNIRRFVVAQYEDVPTINYNQEKWVKICNYQQWNSRILTDLWYLLNMQICEILKNTSVETAQRKCMTGELHTLEWLAVDYIKHLRHHMHQVLELEPVPYP